MEFVAKALVGLGEDFNEFLPFDTLRKAFDKPVLSKVEGLTTNER